MPVYLLTYSSSSSINTADYAKLKNWIKIIAEGLDIGPDGSQISILQFSGTRARPNGRWISQELNFNQSANKENDKKTEN